jgi:hypothetical protein
MSWNKVLPVPWPENDSRQGYMFIFSLTCPEYHSGSHWPCYYTWGFSAEYAEDLIESTSSNKDFRVCIGCSRALVTVHYLISHSANATTAPLLLASLLLMCNPEARYKTTAYTGPGYLSLYSDGLVAGRLGFDSWQGQDFSFSSTVSRPALGPTKLPSSRYRGLFPRGKAAEAWS